MSNRKFKRELKKQKQREKDLKNQNKKINKMVKHKIIDDEVVNIAVYGYLRKGCDNFYHIKDSAKLLGTYYTLPEYTLYSIDGSAGLLKEGSTSVLLEVYEISKSDWYSLEWSNNLEGNLENTHTAKTLYTDKLIQTPFGEAVVFFIDPLQISLNKAHKIPNGDWLDYLGTKVFTKTLFSMLEK
jgi:gamma-glutamylcyclotransferase (GGCT)/AIG2-like uncharacterized protein YtfP